MGRRRVIHLALGLVSLLAAACGRTEGPGGKALLDGAGATFPAPLYKKWAEVYNPAQDKVVVRYTPVGSGEGEKLFLGGQSREVDFGASDAGLTLEQLGRLNDEFAGGAGRGALLVPTAAGAVALAYNLPSLGGELKLPPDVYADIFLGEITRWDDERIRRANPGLALPERDIGLVAREDKSGTTFAFTNHLAVVSPAWRERHAPKGADGTPAGGDAALGVKQVSWPKNTVQVPGNEGVAGVVHDNEGTIGYVEFGLADRAGLQTAALRNAAGNYVRPTARSGTAALAHCDLQGQKYFRAFVPNPPGADSYPIVTFTWLLVYKKYDPAKARGMRDFLRWCLTDGQQYNGELGYIRLPEATCQAVLRAVEEGIEAK